MTVEKEKNHSTNDGYDKSDVNIARVLGFTFTILIVLIAIIVLLYEVFIYSKEQAIYEMVLKPESKALREQLAREDQVLNSYKILDQEKGIYQIPIDQAIQIIANEAYEIRLEKAKKAGDL